MMVKVPRGVVDVVRIFTVAAPEVVTGLPVQLVVTFDGRPDVLSVTAPVKPPVGVMFAVYVAV